MDDNNQQLVEFMNLAHRNALLFWLGALKQKNPELFMDYMGKINFDSTDELEQWAQENGANEDEIHNYESQFYKQFMQYSKGIYGRAPTKMSNIRN